MVYFDLVQNSNFNVNSMKKKSVNINKKESAQYILLKISRNNHESVH